MIHALVACFGIAAPTSWCMPNIASAIGLASTKSLALGDSIGEAEIDRNVPSTVGAWAIDWIGTDKVIHVFHSLEGS